MVVNTISNLHLYKGAYKGLEEVIAYLENTDLNDLPAGRNDVSDTMYVVAMSNDQAGSFDGVMERHEDWIDIHCTLEGTDVVAFAEKDEPAEDVRDYEEEKDYMLNKPEQAYRLEIGKGYFCIIDTTMAHMAIIGQGFLRKAVIKFKKQ